MIIPDGLVLEDIFAQVLCAANESCGHLSQRYLSTADMKGGLSLLPKFDGVSVCDILSFSLLPSSYFRFLYEVDRTGSRVCFSAIFTLFRSVA